MTTVLLANVYHGLTAATVREALRALHPLGRLVIVEWKKGPSSGGPSLNLRKTPEEVGREMRSWGFRKLQRGELREFHYWIAFARRRRPSSRGRRGRPVG